MVTILGVGRSGTSAIARAMQAVGIELGDNLRPGSGKNPTGFFEDNDILKISKRLKRALGVREIKCPEGKVRRVFIVVVNDLYKSIPFVFRQRVLRQEAGY